MNLRRLTQILALVVVVALAVPFIPTAQAQEVITVTQWDGMVTQSPAWERMIQAFEEKYPNINIERTVQQKINDVLPLALESGTGPDLFQPQDWRVAVDSGYLLPIDDLPGFEEFKAKFPEPELDLMKGGGVLDKRVYSAPFERFLPWNQFYVNTKMYRDAGIVDANGEAKLPTTWDDVIANARTIKEKLGADKYGFGFGGADVWAFGWVWYLCQTSGPLHTTQGFGFDARIGKWTTAETPCYSKVLEGLNTMRDEGLIPPNAMSLTDEQIRSEFARGNVASIIGGTWIIPGFKQTNPDFTDQDYALVAHPLVGTDKPISFWYTGPGGTWFGLNAKLKDDPKKLEAAWTYYQFIYGPELGKAWAEEGLGWSLFTPGKPTDYDLDPNLQRFLALNELAILGPQTGDRTPDVTKVQPTLQGPNLENILVGVYTKQITDIKAALADYDQRQLDALNLAIEDARAAGANVCLEAFIVEDWDYTKPYTRQFTEADNPCK